MEGRFTLENHTADDSAVQEINFNNEKKEMISPHPLSDSLNNENFGISCSNPELLKNDIV